MEKLNLSKLIANDIVNYGMDKTMSFNYIVSLNDFLDEYDDETCNYIKAHINEIINDVNTNENVADLEYDEERQEFNLVFYYDQLLMPLERTILNTAQQLGYEIEIDKVRQISYDIENSNEFQNMIKESIINNLKGHDLE
jgi:hypothetical protein